MSVSAIFVIYFHYIMQKKGCQPFFGAKDDNPKSAYDLPPGLIQRNFPQSGIMIVLPAGLSHRFTIDLDDVRRIIKSSVVQAAANAIDIDRHIIFFENPDALYIKSARNYNLDMLESFSVQGFSYLPDQ